MGKCGTCKGRFVDVVDGECADCHMEAMHRLAHFYRTRSESQNRADRRVRDMDFRLVRSGVVGDMESPDDE